MRKINHWWKQLAKDKKITIGFVTLSFIAIVTMTSINMVMKNTELDVDKKEQISSKKANLKSNDENDRASKDEEVKTLPPSDEEDVVKETKKVVDAFVKETPKQEAPKLEAPVPTPVVPPAENKQINVNVNVIGMSGAIANGMVEVKEGSSVFDCLKQMIKQVNGVLHTNGFGKYVYVSGINDLHEKEHGAGSGWVYEVNGVSPNLGAGLYTVNANDRITWTYIYD